MDTFGYKKNTLTRLVKRFESQNEQLAYALTFDHEKCNYGCVSLRKSKIGFPKPKESENGFCGFFGSFDAP